MRIEAVKVGDKVTLRAWATDLPGVHRITPEKLAACGKIAVVQGVDFSDNTIVCLLFGEYNDTGVLWWPVNYCELCEEHKPTQKLPHNHEREVASLRQDIAVAQRAVEVATRLVQNRDREEQVLRSQVAALEKQVADLKSERDRVGKTSQTGTRFAQLELD